jgi:hypothetical protein
MVHAYLLLAAAAALILWGAAHLFPTMSVARGFGPLSPDNRRILVMEWVGEGLTLVFMGALVGGLALSGGPFEPAALWAYRASAALLVAMAAVSAFTGARNRFIAFRLCPWIFSGAALLLVLGSLGSP